jgi:hypothetical protein
MADDPNLPEQPRAEPEIIPPDRTGRRNSSSQSPWQSTWQTSWGQSSWGQDSTRQTQRIFVMRPGPLGFAAIMLVLGLIIAAIVLALIGTLLIWIPAVALCVVIAAVYRFFRR